MGVPTPVKGPCGVCGQVKFRDTKVKATETDKMDPKRHRILDIEVREVNEFDGQGWKCPEHNNGR